MIFKRLWKYPRRSQLDQDSQTRFEKPELGSSELPRTNGLSELEAVSVAPSIPAEPPSAPPINLQEIVSLQAQITELRSKYETEAERHTQLREKLEAESSALRKEVETLKEQAQNEKKLLLQEQAEREKSLHDAEEKEIGLLAEICAFDKALEDSVNGLQMWRSKYEAETRLRAEQKDQLEKSLSKAKAETERLEAKIKDCKESLEDCRKDLAECRSEQQAERELRSQEQEEHLKSLLAAEFERKRLVAEAEDWEKGIDHYHVELQRWRAKWDHTNRLRAAQKEDHKRSLREAEVMRKRLGERLELHEKQLVDCKSMLKAERRLRSQEQEEHKKSMVDAQVDRTGLEARLEAELRNRKAALGQVSMPTNKSRGKAKDGWREMELLQSSKNRKQRREFGGI